MKPMMKEPVPFDRRDPRNKGITGCFMVSFESGGMAYLIASSAESVGKFWFGQPSHCMKQGDF